MAERTATVAVSPASPNGGGRIHAATDKNGGYVLACNGRWVQQANVWDSAAYVLRSQIACSRCVAGLASGRIKLEVAS